MIFGRFFAQTFFRYNADWRKALDREKRYNADSRIWMILGCQKQAYRVRVAYIFKFWAILNFIFEEERTICGAMLREVETSKRLSRDDRLEHASGRRRRRRTSAARSHSRQDKPKEPCACFPDDARSTRQTPSNYCSDAKVNAHAQLEHKLETQLMP